MSDKARKAIAVGFFIVAALACAWPFVGGSLPLPSIVAPAATSATYVYEKDTTAIPAAVMAGLNRLNREKKVIATVFEQDTTDGAGEIPDQYKTAVAEAKKAGLPSLVVMSGANVVEVVKNPTTVDQILEAVK